ncbi:GntR family transcriptional regulator [Chthonobacter rhizosphaerae]|uniref:GntR family transcriptional regulator n=1 Tax=Chthonobacter rhizosphaerae TaxID=2735553 RepID=UPI0015EFC9B0|nr:GntR family transcriptional regulator [Chthonobacter rhizosphaerae]
MLSALATLDEDHPRNRRVTVSGRVLDTLRDAIIQLRFSPGNPLSEADVARQLGVSRQPVREAFIKLAEAGLLEIRPQRGTFVRKISRREVANARFIREAIEVAIARKAAAEATGDRLSDLDALIEGQRRAAGDGDHAGFLRLDEAFHQGLADAAGCEDAWRVLEGLKAQMDRVRYLSLPDATPLHVLIEQHAAILDGVRARDPDRAEAAMKRHLSEILFSLPRLAEAHPAFFLD